MKKKPAILIDSIAECTLGTFKQCAYAEKFHGLIVSGKPTLDELKKAFKKIYTEFVDESGLAETEEFEIMKVIYYLDSRVKRIHLLLYVQRESLKHIGVPCTGAFSRFWYYGYKLVWNGDIENFIEQLENVASNESTYEDQLKEKIDELTKTKKGDRPVTAIDKRRSFIRLQNALQRAGNKIDDNITNMEAFALMVLDHNDAAMNQNLNGNN